MQNYCSLPVPLTWAALCQMLSLMEAQSHFFKHGHQSLSELDRYRQQLNEEAGFLFRFPVIHQNARGARRTGSHSCLLLHVRATAQE